MRRARVAWAIMATVIVMSSAGCGFGRSIIGMFHNTADDYAQINDALLNETREYRKVQLTVIDEDDQPRPNVLTEQQKKEYKVKEDAVADMNHLVYIDMTNWATQNVRPVSLDSNIKALRAAHKDFIAYVRKVTP